MSWWRAFLVYWSRFDRFTGFFLFDLSARRSFPVARPLCQPFELPIYSPPQLLLFSFFLGFPGLASFFAPPAPIAFGPRLFVFFQFPQSPPNPFVKRRVLQPGRIFLPDLLFSRPNFPDFFRLLSFPPVPNGFAFRLPFTCLLFLNDTIFPPMAFFPYPSNYAFPADFFLNSPSSKRLTPFHWIS